MCHIISKSKLSRYEGLTLTGDRWIVGDRSCSDSVFINGSPNICEYGAFVTTVCFLVFCIFFVPLPFFFSIHFFSQSHVSVCLIIENSVPPPPLTEGKCSYFCECRNTHTHALSLYIYTFHSYTHARTLLYSLSLSFSFYHFTCTHKYSLSPYTYTDIHTHTFTLLHI